MTKPEEYIKRIDELIALASKTLDSAYKTSVSIYVQEELFANFKTASLSCLRNMYGTEHPYYIEFDTKVRGAVPGCVAQGRGILSAVKAEIEGGWFFTVKKLVTAEIFSDFMEMAKYLLDEKYHIPAAIMLGSILEEHLKQLATKNNIALEFTNDKGASVPKKADTINAELTASTVYNKLDQKQVTAWLDLRNKAAHGKYEEFTIEQVNLFYSSLLDFINRVSI